MDSTAPNSYIAFAGSTRLAQGDLRTVASAVKGNADAGRGDIVIVLDAVSSEPVELDMRGALEDVLGRLPISSADQAAEVRADTTQPVDAGEEVSRRPGRPRLGVVSREVTLLPRHWEWLASQPGGASVTLRKLVDEARKSGGERERVRRARDATYRFAVAVAGDEAGFEEAMRALYAGDLARFGSCVATWPPDVREHALHLAASSLERED